MFVIKISQSHLCNQNQLLNLMNKCDQELYEVLGTENSLFIQKIRNVMCAYLLRTQLRSANQNQYLCDITLPWVGVGHVTTNMLMSMAGIRYSRNAMTSVIQLVHAAQVTKVMRRSDNFGLTLGHRLRRWPEIKPTLGDASCLQGHGYTCSLQLKVSDSMCSSPAGMIE